MSLRKVSDKAREEFRRRISQFSEQPSSARSSIQPPSLQQPRKRSARPVISEDLPRKRQKSVEEFVESIDHKLDDILIRQRRLEEQVTNLRKSLENINTSVDTKYKSFVDVIKFLKHFYYNFIYVCTNIQF